MARSFCPTIRVKCSRAHSRGEVSVFGKKGIRARAAKFKSAKKRLLKSLRGFGNVHPNAEATSLPAVATKVAHAAANEAKCTVSMGGRHWKLKGAKAGQKVASLLRELRAGGCCSPKVSRG